jgi:outer membrane immunogenic protein
MRRGLALVCAVSTFAFAQLASAANVDLPVYKAPPPGYSWTGFYVGASIGGKWADTTWTTTSLVEGNAPPCPLDNNTNCSAIDGSSPRNYNLSSGRFGGFLGYNWQFAPQWVLGIEFDLAGANSTKTAVGVPGCTISCITTSDTGAIPGPGADLSSVKMGWDASARGRLGYLVSPSLLIYGTGGIAWQKIETSATCQHSIPDPLCRRIEPAEPFITVTNRTTRTGWTIGGGVDARIVGNWILRGEYRYSDFGTWNNSFDLSLPGVGTYTTFIGTQLKIKTQIATLGIAYKF